MIAIIITEENKEANNLSNAVGSIMTRSDYPNAWNGVQNVVGGYPSLTELHEPDGWGNVIPVEILPNQRRGQIIPIPDSPDFTYEIIDLTDAEIEANIASQSESNKDVQIQANLTNQVVTTLQESTDANLQLQNIDVFPWWSADGIEYTIGLKVKYIDNLELKLYRVEQTHTSQEGWQPPNVPALFTRVAQEGEVLVWTQPTGQQDAYQTGDIVWFPDVDTEKWISTADNNVWQPGVFGWEVYTG